MKTRMSKSRFVTTMEENWPFIMAYTHIWQHLPLACSHKLPRFFLLLLPSTPKPLFSISSTFSSPSYAALKIHLNSIQLSLLQSVCKQRWEVQDGQCVVGVIALVPRCVQYCLKHAIMWGECFLTSFTWSAWTLIRRSPARI